MQPIYVFSLIFATLCCPHYANKSGRLTLQAWSASRESHASFKKTNKQKTGKGKIPSSFTQSLQLCRYPSSRINGKKTNFSVKVFFVVYVTRKNYRYLVVPPSLPAGCLASFQPINWGKVLTVSIHSLLGWGSRLPSYRWPAWRERAWILVFSYSQGRLILQSYR